MIEALERAEDSAPAPEGGPLGACWMRCCGRWEEDDNAVNWSSLQDGGYLHWRCRG